MNVVLMSRICSNTGSFGGSYWYLIEASPLGNRLVSYHQWFAEEERTHKGVACNGFADLVLLILHFDTITCSFYPDWAGVQILKNITKYLNRQPMGWPSSFLYPYFQRFSSRQSRCGISVTMQLASVWRRRHQPAGESAGVRNWQGSCLKRSDCRSTAATACKV